jgi:hypothetical protein
VCPFHALGASVILNCVVDRLFPTVTEGAESSHTNDVLREAGIALSGSITPGTEVEGGCMYIYVHVSILRLSMYICMHVYVYHLD